MSRQQRRDDPEAMPQAALDWEQLLENAKDVALGVMGVGAGAGLVFIALMANVRPTSGATQSTRLRWEERRVRLAVEHRQDVEEFPTERSLEADGK